MLLYSCTTWTWTKFSEKKIWWILRKNAAYCFEQIQEVPLYKTIEPNKKIGRMSRESQRSPCWRNALIMMIHWEMSKKFKFDNTNKWYMHNPASVLENDTYNLLWDFDLARRQDLIIINTHKKRICKIVDFAVQADNRIKLKECEKKDKYLDLVRELKKRWNMKATIIPIVICAFGTESKWLLKGLED